MSQASGQRAGSMLPWASGVSEYFVVTAGNAGLVAPAGAAVGAGVLTADEALAELLLLAELWEALEDPPPQPAATAPANISPTVSDHRPEWCPTSDRTGSLDQLHGGQPSGGMGRLAPVDEERHDARVGAGRRRSQPPAEGDAVGTRATHRARLTRVVPGPPRPGNGGVDPRHPNGPGDQSRTGELVDAERTRHRRRRCGGIGTDDLQVALAEADEGVPRPEARMPAALRRTRAERLLDVAHRALQVRGRVDEMIEDCTHRRRTVHVLPGMHHPHSAVAVVGEPDGVSEERVEDPADGVREEEDGPVRVVGHVDDVGEGEQAEPVAEQPCTPLEGHRRQPGADDTSTPRVPNDKFD